ncbi:competence protein ComK [Virgibacillus halophilus]|uniref:Competence protein ComK n=1 Tax=Tigheibacillus halophilus TaxID=361280 RepID=A0ABU5C4E0_9BACI|nr:competence protein ComK [Virgibacillus halophilus]
MPKKAIYMLPTSSTRRKDCAWLSFYQIDFYEQRDNRCYVQFLDGTGIYIPSSANTVDMQHKRTSQIIARLNRPSMYNTYYAAQSAKSGGSIM